MNKTIITCLSFLVLLILAAIIGPEISPHSISQVSSKQLHPPSAEHWLGTDLNGRDIFTRTLAGARISLLVGFVGAAVSLFIGTSYGIISGYIGGKTDLIMMRIVDILYSLPRIIIIMVVIAIFDEKAKNLLASLELPGLINYSRLIFLFICLGAIEWLTMARIVRGQVLVLKERPFIQAAKNLGQSHLKVMTLHLLPNLTGIILVYLTLTIPAVILEESFLSFLGLGVQPPQSSWGTLLADGIIQINPVKICWWLPIAPAIFMAITLLALNFLGDSLRDLYDPRSRK